MSYTWLRSPSHRMEWGCLALLALILTLRFPIKFLFGSPYLMDFNVYRTAAELVTTGQGHLLYTLAYSEGMYFKYAPIWALLWSPFAYLSTFHGIVVWSTLNVGWLLLMLWCAGRIVTLAGLRYSFWVPAVAVLLLVRSLIAEFSNGQADLWWAGLVVLFLYYEVKQRYWLAALCLALSILLKPPSGIFLPYLLLTKRRLTGVFVLGWLCVLLPLGAYGVDLGHPVDLLIAWGRLLATTAPQQALRIGDQSLLALLGRFFTADGYGLNILALSRPAVIIVAMLLNTLLFSITVMPSLRRLSNNTPTLIYDASLLMVVMVLASPAAWLAAYSALLFPACVALGQLAELIRTPQVERWTVVLAGGCGFFSLLTHSKFWKAIGVFSWKSESYVYLVFMTLPFFGLALFGLLWQQRHLSCQRVGESQHTSHN